MTSSVSGTTRFVGRHRELASVHNLLRPSRLVTLTGPGGIGKSRLAGRIAQQRSGDVWVVDLAGVADPTLVAYDVAHQLRLRSGAAATVADVVGFVGDRAALLVLDNVDRVVPAVRDLVQALLDGCPALDVVVTSREVLGLAVERVLPVGLLGLPDLDDDLTPESAGRSEAVRLFVDRASSVNPAFRLTEDNVRPVVDLCSALDGLPLAIELAAARVRELSPEAMLERLENRYRLLDGRLRDVPARLGSLEASMQWSYDLCTPAEQLLWARLSVFDGGFGLPGAQRVCSGDGLAEEDIPALVDGLVSRSIVNVDLTVDPPHHQMLDSVREYGAARLADHGGDDPWRERHAHWFADLAREFSDDWVGPRQPWWLDRLRRNHRNLVSALSRPHARRTRMLVDLQMYCVASGNLATARHCAEQVLGSEDGDVADRFRARCVNAYLAALLGDEHGAAALVAGLRADAPSVADDPAARAALAHADGVVRLFAGDLEAGAELVAAAVDDARAAVLATEELNLRVLLAMLRTALRDARGTDEALTALLARCQELGDGYARSYGLWVAGRRARDTGDLDRAVALERDALALKWPLRDLAGLGMVLETLAAIADDVGDTLQRARLLGAASRLWRRVAPSPVTRAYSQAQHDLADRMARGEVDEAFARAYREGATTEVEDTVADLLEGLARQFTDQLSPREHEVAALVGQGLTNQQIANRLVISVRTVHGHMENILRKLGFGSRAQVAAWVARQSVGRARRELSPPASGS